MRGERRLERRQPQAAVDDAREVAGLVLDDPRLRTARQARPSRADARGTGPGTSPHSRGVGKTLPGLRARPDRSRVRTRCIASRSSSLNISGIAHALSVPTPCSPVIEPPASMQASRIGRASSSARSASPVDARVVEHERVQVAVAGVEDVADAQAVLARRARRSAAAPPAASCAARRRPARSSSGLTRPIAANAALRPCQIRGALGGVGGDADLAAPALAAELLDERRDRARPAAARPSSSTISTASQPAESRRRRRPRPPRSSVGPSSRSPPA